MKKVMIIITFFIFTYTHSQEIGVSVGGVAFLGDLGGNRGIGRTFLKDLQFSEIHKMIGISAGFQTTDYAFYLNYSFGTLSGSDNSIRNRGGAEAFRFTRNLSFQSSFHEFGLNAQRFFGPLFITSGTGLTKFQKGSEVEKRYSDVQPFIRYGFGTRHSINERLSLQLEIAGRKFFTDYIDDVSLRGDPTENDSYVTCGFTIVFKGLFRKDPLPCPKFYY